MEEMYGYLLFIIWTAIVVSITASTTYYYCENKKHKDD